MQDLERQESILNYLKTHHSATVDYLSKNFYASPSTIRRDLTSLEATGVIHRTHGGAIYNDKLKEVSILIRKNENTEVKTKLAQIASHYIPKFNSIFIDNSSTCLPLLKKLDFNNKLVVTNSLQVVNEIYANFDAKIIFVGGEVNLNNMDSHGELTVKNIAQFHYDVMISSASFVNSTGSFESSYNTAVIKKTAMECSTKKILIFDSSKTYSSASFLTSHLSKYDLLITDMDDKEVETFQKDNPYLKIYNM